MPRRREPLGGRAPWRFEPLARDVDQPLDLRLAQHLRAAGRAAARALDRERSDRRRAGPRDRDACGTGGPRKAGARARRREPARAAVGLKRADVVVGGARAASPRARQEFAIGAPGRADRPRSVLLAPRRARRRSLRENPRSGADGARSRSCGHFGFGSTTVWHVARLHLDEGHQRDHRAIDQAASRPSRTRKRNQAGHQRRLRTKPAAGAARNA